VRLKDTGDILADLEASFAANVAEEARREADAARRNTARWAEQQAEPDIDPMAELLETQARVARLHASVTETAPQPSSAMETLRAAGPADIDDIIAAYKIDNGLSGQSLPQQEDAEDQPQPVKPHRAHAHNADPIREAADIARQYVEDHGAERTQTVDAYVFDVSGLRVPRSGGSRMRFLRLAGLTTSACHSRGKRGCDHYNYVKANSATPETKPEIEPESKPGTLKANPAGTPRDRVSRTLRRVLMFPARLSRYIYDIDATMTSSASMTPKASRYFTPVITLLHLL
jgi:hypothetical protein